jgi:indolepyruvate ferredoxin oxidoreductase beta subunit
MLYLLSGLKRWRRGTLRFHEENTRIEAWLARIEALATDNYPVAVELAKAQRLVKGYGETHERGWRNFSTLLEQVDLLASRSDGGTVLARLIEAALADEEGAALGREINSLRAASQLAPASAESARALA